MPSSRMHQNVYRHLREYRDALGAPADFTWPEISHGQLLMMMSPKAQHQLIGTKIRRGLESQLGDHLMVMLETDVEDPGLGILRVPDLIVVDVEVEPTSSDTLAPTDCHLIIEIVSRSNPGNDYEGKLADYPAMGVPHYVIIDPRDGTAVHHWEPSTRTGRPAYDNRQHFTFGDTITVETWKIDTSPLSVYDTGQDAQ